MVKWSIMIIGKQKYFFSLLGIMLLVVFHVGCGNGGIIEPEDASVNQTDDDASDASINPDQVGKPDGAIASENNPEEGTNEQIQSPRSLGDLSGPWQLFVDDFLIASKSAVQRTYHEFQKHPGNPVLKPDKPWEGHLIYIYGTVLPKEDGTGFRIWYQDINETMNEPSQVLYAESVDGIVWEKPDTGNRSWGSYTNNNLFFSRVGENGMPSIMHTPWDPDADRQYQIINYTGSGYMGAYSPDGIHTTDTASNPVFSYEGIGDVGQFLWDPHSQQFLGYVKINTTVNNMKRRSVGLMKGTSIESLGAPKLVLEPDSIDDRWATPPKRTHLYGLSAFAYESLYLGFLWIFRATDAEGYTIGKVYSEIVSSHDGENWVREEGDRPPILPLGANGAWDDGQLYTATSPLVVGDELWLYYGAADDVHGTKLPQMNAAIGLAKLRKDGFASLDAGEAEGLVATKTLKGAKGSLHLNYKATTGVVRVEVLDDAGNPISGYGRNDCIGLTGDSVNEAVKWGTQISLPEDRNIQLRFILQNASLYSFMAGDDLTLAN